MAKNIGLKPIYLFGFDSSTNKWVPVPLETRKQTPSSDYVLNVQIGPGDVISNIPVMIDFDHHQVHEGEYYLAQNIQASLGTNTVKYGITVPVFADVTRCPHVVITCDVYNGAALVQMYEGSTFTSGSDVTANNRNRNSLNVAGMTIKSGVTSTNGTLVKSFYAGAGSRTSGSSRSDAEMVLKSNTVYRVDVVGQVAGTAAVVGFSWYEDLGV